jgi:hypothetical protein
MERLYRRRRDITQFWEKLSDGSGTGTIQLKALGIRWGATVGVAGGEGFAGLGRRPHGGGGDRQMGRIGTRSDVVVRAKPLILLNGDKVTSVALHNSLIYRNIRDSHKRR